MGDLRFNEWQAVDGTPVLRFNAGELQVWDGAEWAEAGAGEPLFEYVVIAGGGGGGGDTNNGNGSGGGAGGYRSSVSGENSGGGTTAEFPLFLASGTYSVSIGAGGAPNVNGNNSYFGPVISLGGGRGQKVYDNHFGGSGGGGQGSADLGKDGIPGQGHKGGNGGGTSSFVSGGGGGGAGSVGETAPSGIPGDGGTGVSSSITGAAVGRAGGGGGGAYNGGTGVGVDGGGSTNVDGTVNTGGGGGGGNRYADGGSGGSGVVILKYPSSITLSIGAGLTSSTATSGDFKITSFTAGTDTVTF